MCFFVKWTVGNTDLYTSQTKLAVHVHLSLTDVCLILYSTKHKMKLDRIRSLDWLQLKLLVMKRSRSKYQAQWL